MRLEGRIVQKQSSVLEIDKIIKISSFSEIVRS